MSNTLSVEINLDRHSIEDLADIEGVTAITPNVEVTHPAPPETGEELTASLEQNQNYTYGLQQIGIPSFEEKYGDRGGNATVTVIDDGVSDPDNIHPDLDFAQTAIASDGNITTGTLGSPGGHGEHVVGTISGAADPAGDVPRYGVAPNANVIMINAFEGGATLVDILASVEYSVEQDSDVTSMSLGFGSTTGFSTISNVVEDTMQDAVAAGTLVTVSAGNSGAGDTGGPTTSPGAEFTSMSIGASNEEGNIAAFSSGDIINPNQVELIDQGGTYPDNFPREYANPDVSAPGVQVLSTGPLGTIEQENPTYSYASGTSMAAPHVAGAATLLQSMTEEDLDPKMIEMALAETAEKPDGADYPSRFGRDIRYGTGIINVTAAADALMNGSMAVSGTVSDTGGDPIEGASVSADSDALTSTNESGAYTLHTTQDEVTITADAFGYEASTQTVSSDDSPVDFTLEDAMEIDLVEGQRVFAEFGGYVNATVDVRNLESLTVETTEETNVSQDALTLLVNGQEETLGEAVELDRFNGTAEVRVELADDASYSEGQVLGLEHTFEGLGDSITVETGPTTLTEELEPAFFELSNLNAPDEITAGNPLPLTVDVTNTGQVTATKDVQVVVAQGGTEGSLPPSSYELEPGETTTVQVNAAGVGGLFSAGQDFEAGFRSADSIEQAFLGGYTVNGLNDEINTSVALQAQGSSFQISSLDAPTEVDPGAEVEVTATVQNIGAESAEQDVTFQFDGQTVATESVALDAYELNSTTDSAEVTFTVTAPDEEDVYTHGVATEDDNATATLGVGVSIPSVTVVSTNEYGPDTVTLLEQGLALNGQAAQVEYASASEVDSEMMTNTDVFVFHNLEGVAGDVIPMVENDPTTTAVYLEQFADSNAIAQRSEVIGDPASATADFEIGGPPVEFTVTQDHPLFDGVADAGESFVVHTSGDSDYVYFEGASGETLAESGLQGSAPAGPTAAVDPDSGSVLLGTIAPNTYEPVDAFTDDAARVLANSVSVAQDGIVTDAVGSTSIDADFIGTVDDAEDITVTANDIVADGEVVNGDTITFTVGGEPVTTATVENGTAEATFDPQTLDADAGETLTVGVEEYSVIDAAEVDTVDETYDLQDGFNLLSVPQAADLVTENVSAVNTWNSSAGTYDSVTASTFDSASDLHQGLYISAAADDARLGFTFSEDVPVGGTADINNGWNLLGSNFPIDSPEDGDTRSLDEDLIEVNPDELTVFNSGFNQQYDGNSTIGGYEAYWAFNDENTSYERAIISPSYEVEDREDVLGLEDSDFEITTVDATVVPRDEAEQVDNHQVLGSDEQMVEVDVAVTNNGGLDTQFVDLNVSDARVDRSLGVTLDEGETEIVTLTYVLSQDDVPGLTVEALTEDDSATADVELGVDGLTVEEQALTLDDEFIVSDVDYNGEATIEVVSNDSVVGSETVSDTATNLAIDVDASQIEDNTVEVRLLNADGEQETNETVSIEETTIEVTNDAPAFALADEDSVTVPVDVTNNALIEQTVEVGFSVNGSAVANTTVDVGPGDNAGVTAFSADISGLEVGDTVEHTVSAVDSSDTKTLTIAESTLTFDNQSMNADGEVLVEDVTASDDQTVVITDTDFNIEGQTEVGEINGENVLVDVSDAEPGQYIAHIVSDTSDVSDGPGLVYDQATVVDADVTVGNVSKSFDEDETAEVSEIPVSTADVEAATETNFIVEIRQNGDTIGDSETLTGSNSVSVTLDSPITSNTTIDAVLVDNESGEAFQEASEDGLVDVSDSAEVTISVDELDASVSLPDQELSSYNGSDSVLVEDVTGDASQYVVITDSDLNVVGTHALEGDVASEDIEIALDESVESGEYRAHLTSDVQLVGDGDDIVTDAGVLVNASVTFTNQSYLDDTKTVTVDSTSVDDGIGGETGYSVKLHEVTESGDVGGIVGSSSTLTGTQDDVTVSLYDSESIEETGEYVAMLHFADGSSIGESPVTDRATVTINPTDASYQLSDLEPAETTVDTGQTFSVSATVTNTGDLAGNQTIELRLDGDVVATETDVEIAGGDSTTVTFEGVSVSEVGEYTHTVASEDDTVSGVLTVVAEEVTFNDQSATDGQVLVEDVTTASADQKVVITDSEFDIVGQSDELGMVVQDDILIDLDEENPTGEYIAHVVANASDVGSNGPNLVTDQATLVDADVSVDNVTVTETEENLPVSVDEITVDTAAVVDADTDGTNFTVELRQDGGMIGESDTLNGSNSDVQISLDTPIEATSVGTLTEDITAVLVDETGTAFQEPDVDQTAFQDVSDDATVEITVSPADASVSLPDQEIGAANGGDAVYTTDVTGDAGQYVVITDGEQNIIGSTELDERAAGDQVIVELDETIERGQYRAHLTTDVGLIGGDALITDSGEVYDAAVSFEDQEFVGATEEVTVATAELLDDADNTTDFAVAIHETENGAVGDIIGNTTGLNGTESDVEVTLDDGESISENGDYVAMLHFDDSGDLGAPIQAVEDATTVAPVTDGATITSIEGALKFNDQSFNATDGNVVVEDVQANVSSTLVLTYTDADGNLTIAGIGSTTYENATPNDLEVPVDNASGFPGEHTAHLIPTDEVSDLGNYSAGDEVSDATAANAIVSKSATVFDTTLTIEDQSVEDSTESVTVTTADLFDDVDNSSNIGDTEFGVAIHENGSASGDIIGFEGGLTANNSDITVGLDREINSTEDVVAMLHVSNNGQIGAPITESDGSGLAPVTDGPATVTVQQAVGGNVDLSEQAIGTDGDVVVENVTAVDVETIGGSDPATDAFDPADDFLVLTDGDSVADGDAGVIDAVQLSNVSGDIKTGTDVTLNASGATAGEYTVVLHEPNAAGDAPDPAAPRTNASSGEIVDASATVFTGDVVVNDQTLVEDQDALDTITLDTAELDDGSADGATFTVVVENSSNDAELGNKTVTGSTTTVQLDDALPRGDTDITVRLEQDGAPVERAPGFNPITDSATVTTEQSEFDLTLNAVNGNTTGSAEVAEGTANVNVSVDVTNNGDFDDEQDITAEIVNSSGDVVASDTFAGFQVFQDETREITLDDLSTGDLAPGTYDVNVRSDDDQVSGELEVLAPNAELEELSIGGDGTNAELTLDQTTENIDVTVNNTGDIQYTGNVTLTVSNASGTQISEEKSVGSVGAGNTSGVTFSDVVVGDLSQGEYDVTVESDDDITTGTLSVLAVEVTSLDIDGNGTSLTIDEGDGPVKVSAQFTNFNDEFENRDVTLTVGDNELTRSFDGLQLSAGETRTYNFTDVAVDTLAAGDYDVTVATPQTNTTGSLQVDNLAVDINSADSSLSVIDNETAVVNTTLTNEGDSSVTQTIELNVSGVSGVQDSQQVTVGGGNSTTIDLSYQTNLSDDGATVTVTSDQDSAQEPLSVQSLQDALPADDGSLTLEATTYAENITISANNTTITGAGTDATTIDGNVTIEGDDNTIEDLTIVGNVTNNGSGNSLADANVTSASPGGTIFVDGSNSSLTDVTAEDVEINATDTVVQNTVATNVSVGSNGGASLNGVEATSYDIDESANVDVTNPTVRVESTDELTAATTGGTVNGLNVSAATGTVTVRVADNTYDTSVDVTVDNLTLEAADGATPTITQDGSDVVTITADDVTVDGLTIEANGSADAVALDLSDGENVTLTNNVIDIRDDSANGVGINAAEAGTSTSIGTATIGDNEFLAEGLNGEVYVNNSETQLTLSDVTADNKFNLDAIEDSNQLVPGVTLAESDQLFATGLEERVSPADGETALGAAFGQSSGAFNVDGFNSTGNGEIQIAADFNQSVDANNLDVELSTIGGDNVTEVTGVLVVLTPDSQDADYTQTDASAYFLTDAGIVSIGQIEGENNFINAAERPVDNLVNDGQGVERAIEEVENQANTTVKQENLRTVVTNLESDDKDVRGVTINGETIPLSDELFVIN